jgi:hypothetical protein
LPIACEYSQRIIGRGSSVFAVAHATIESSSGYIGQTTSVAGRPPLQSRLIAPS